MLILTRRVGETLVIGDDVTVTVLGVKGNQIRLGVNAPKEVAVHREEIYQRIQQEKSEGKIPEEAVSEDTHRSPIVRSETKPGQSKLESSNRNCRAIREE